MGRAHYAIACTCNIGCTRRWRTRLISLQLVAPLSGCADALLAHTPRVSIRRQQRAEMTASCSGYHSNALSLRWLLLASALSTVCSKTFNMGLLTPMTGHWPIGLRSASAIEIAIEDIHNDEELVMLRRGGHNFTYSWRDTGCKQAKGLKALVDLWANKDGTKPLDAIIGTW